MRIVQQGKNKTWRSPPPPSCNYKYQFRKNKKRKIRTTVKMLEGSWTWQKQHIRTTTICSLQFQKLEFLKELSSKSNELQMHLLLEPISPFMPQVLIQVAFLFHLPCFPFDLT
jgi:hypothetical protein